MKVLFTLLALSFASSLSWANITEVSNCRSESKTHRLTMMNATDAVELTFEEIGSEDYGKIPGSNYKVSGITTTRRLIHGIQLNELTHKRSLISESLVSIMRSRIEFDGDADMHYAYANDFIQAMVCK
ncbi:hypothetical protein D3C87_1649200 [compost metagenome]